jgi:hypothetical protein
VCALPLFRSPLLSLDMRVVHGNMQRAVLTDVLQGRRVFPRPGPPSPCSRQEAHRVKANDFGAAGHHRHTTKNGRQVQEICLGMFLQWLIWKPELSDLCCGQQILLTVNGARMLPWGTNERLRLA